MKKFLLISLSLLVVSLLMVVAVFFYVSVQLKQSQTEVVGLPATPQASTTKDSSEDAVAVESSTAKEGIPLRDLPLGEGQRSVLETVGVDVDTFIITPEIQACAALKLGDERMNAIIAGEAPTVFETTKLLSCL